VKIRKSSIVLLVFTLYGINYFLFERVLFFNELLSLIGLLLFINYSFTRSGKFILPHNMVYRHVLYFIVLGFLYAIFSLPIKTNWYFYFRNLSIIYSAFAFFIGFYLYEQQFEFYQRAKKWIYGYALFAFGARWEFLIDRNAYAFWFALVKKDWRITSVLLLVGLYALYVISYTSLTVILILMIVLGIRYIKNYNQFKLVAFGAFFVFLLVFVSAIPFLKLYKYDPVSLFGDVLFVYEQHPWFQIDHNSSWRLIFWYRTLVESFPQNLFGIGIGTPLLPYSIGTNSTGLPVDDQTLAHVVGTHNTFITIFVRFGIISIMIFGVVYDIVLKEFFKYKNYYLTHKNDGGVFLGFVTLTCVGLFNLLIETVTLSALYWISLGFVAAAINIRRFSNAKD
jgi:hypothetical protein